MTVFLLAALSACRSEEENAARPGGLVGVPPGEQDAGPLRTDSAEDAGAPADVRRPPGPARDGGEGDGGNGSSQPPERPSFPTPLRRLSHGEYANTVRDLFPGVDLITQRFAADVTVNGFENNAQTQAASALLVEQYRASAIEISRLALPQISLPCERQELAPPCLVAFVEAFGARAFRRPLTAAELEAFSDFGVAQLPQAGPDGALELLLQAMLQAPQFLYRLEVGGEVGAGEALIPLSAYDVASRLSYLIWASMPDAELFESARLGYLLSVEELEAQARRMLRDDRARRGLMEFFRQWLSMDKVKGLNKDPTTYPGFNASLRDAMRLEPERFIEEALFNEDGRLQTLLTAPWSFANAPLAALYGLEVPDDGGWHRVELAASERGGLLSQGHFLTSHAHVVHPSPVQRGVFVLERLLCRPPAPPDPSIDITPPTEADSLEPRTNRERYDDHVSNAECLSCHEAIDGIGFAFESYDAIGRFRTSDNGYPVDARGRLQLDQERVDVDGVVELSRVLAQSEEVHRCVAVQWFRYAFGREEGLADAAILRVLGDAFFQADGDIRELLLAIVAMDNFRFRVASTPAVSP